MTDYEWRHLKPEEVAGPGRATVTSSPSCPTPPSGSARTGLSQLLVVDAIRGAWWR